MTNDQMSTKRKRETGKVGRGEKVKRTKGDRACRRCGCTWLNPCTDKLGQSCCWVAQDLCSACLTALERDLVSLPLKLKLQSETLDGMARMLLKDAKNAQMLIRSVLKGGPL